MKKIIFYIFLSIICLNAFLYFTSCQKTYDIIYELNGGENSVYNPNNYTIGEIVNLNNPTKKDHMFLGWYTDPEFIHEVKEIDKYTDDIILYAKWIPYEHIISFREVNGGYSVQCCNVDIETIIIPSTYKGLPVISIENFAISPDKNIKKIVIPETIRFIEINAFSESKSLEFIEVNPRNTSFKSIDGVLYSKDGKNIIRYPAGKKDALFRIPEEVITIQDKAFINCTNLVNIEFSQNLKSIGFKSFSACTVLDSIIIPNSVVHIGEYAFSNCSSLKGVILPSNISSISKGQFYKCEALKNIIIPKNVKSIGNNSFYGCKSLESVTIPSSVVSIGEWAFIYCTSLEKMVIPDSVITIENMAFGFSPSLTVFCGVNQKPEGWNELWKYNDVSTIWDYTKDLVSMWKIDTNISDELIEFTAKTFLQEMGLSWYYSLNIRVDNNQIYLNNILYSNVSYVEDFEINYSDTFIMHISHANMDVRMYDTLEQIKTKNKYYILETDSSNVKFGKIIIVCEIDGSYYFINFSEDGNVLRIHSANIIGG